jgi:hypothetical protein
MIGFYRFLIWFFTIVSLIALIYGVLDANISYIGLFIGALIVSVIFYRLGENSPKDVTGDVTINEISSDGIDNDNTELAAAVETLNQAQTKLLTEFKSKIYNSEEILNLKVIKNTIIREFINNLSIGYELTTKPELQDVLLRLFDKLLINNVNFLFDPNFYPSELRAYGDWIKRSFILLGWTQHLTNYSQDSFFTFVFEKSGLIAGIIIPGDMSVQSINYKQHRHFIENGSVDFIVFVSPENVKMNTNLLQENDKIIFLKHQDLPNLMLEIKKML